MYTFPTYYCGLKVSVGGEYRGRLYFMCGLKIKLVYKNVELLVEILKIDKMFEYWVLI